MKNNEENPNINIDVQPERGYTYFCNPIPAKIHHFYINKVIDDPETFVDMVHTIKIADQNDIVYIYLNSPGGRLDTAVQLINAMRISAAKIITVIEAEAHSASTMIFLAADEFIVHENSIMMFHNFSSGAIGKGNEIKLQIDAVVKWFNRLARDIYFPFLSEQEIQNIIDGKDLWIEADEIRERLHHMVDVITKEREKQEAADRKEAKLAANVSPKPKKRKAKV